MVGHNVRASSDHRQLAPSQRGHTDEQHEKVEPGSSRESEARYPRTKTAAGNEHAGLVRFAVLLQAESRWQEWRCQRVSKLSWIGQRPVGSYRINKRAKQHALMESAKVVWPMLEQLLRSRCIHVVPAPVSAETF